MTPDVKPVASFFTRPLTPIAVALPDGVGEVRIQILASQGGTGPYWTNNRNHWFPLDHSYWNQDTITFLDKLIPEELANGQFVVNFGYIAQQDLEEVQQYGLNLKPDKVLKIAVNENNFNIEVEKNAHELGVFFSELDQILEDYPQDQKLHTQIHQFKDRFDRFVSKTVLPKWVLQHILPQITNNQRIVLNLDNRPAEPDKKSCGSCGDTTWKPNKPD